MWVVPAYEVPSEKVVDGVMSTPGAIFNPNPSRGGTQLSEGGWHGYHLFFLTRWAYRIGTPTP